MLMTTSTTDVHGTFTAAVPFWVPFYASCIRLSFTHRSFFPPIPFILSTYAHTVVVGLSSKPIGKHTLALAKDCDAFYYIYLIVHNRTRLELTNTVCWCHTDAPAGAPAIEMDIRLNFFRAEHICRNDAMPANIRILFYENVGTHLCHFGTIKGKIAYFCRCWRCSCETTQFDILFFFSFFLLFRLLCSSSGCSTKMLAKWFNKFLGFENWYKLASSMCRVLQEAATCDEDSIWHAQRAWYRVRLSRLSGECIPLNREFNYLRSISMGFTTLPRCLRSFQHKCRPLVARRSWVESRSPRSRSTINQSAFHMRK